VWTYRFRTTHVPWLHLKKAKKLKPPKKSKQITLNRLQKILWEECKRITRERHGNKCFTCGKTGLSGSDWHTGHFIPKGVCGAFLKYDLRNLRPQCYNCNINLGGAGAEFYRRLVEYEGQEYVNKLFSDQHIVVSAREHYHELLIKYRNT
jgi:hypothetical protein